MGVTGFFYMWMNYVQNKPNTTLSFNEYVASRKIPNVKYRSLSLDLPGIIYDSVRKVFLRKESAKLNREPVTEERDYKFLMTSLYSEITDRITNIVRLFHNPKNRLEVVIIAIDGKAPMAKIQQQRRRRYLGSLEESDFDFSQISPGTDFMEDINVYLRNWVSENTYAGKGDEILPSQVIYSSYSSPGEGEHKIMEYYRNQEDTSGYHLLYGQDNDLILLSMLSPLNGIIIMKEFPEREEEIDIVSTPGYSAQTKTKTIRQRDNVSYINIDNFKELLRQYYINIEDYVFIMNLAGNDFLPTQPCFEIYKPDTMAKIIDSYIYLRGNFIEEKIIGRNEPLLIKDGILQYERISVFFKSMKSIEQDLVKINTEIMLDENGHGFFSDSRDEIKSTFSLFRSKWYSIKVLKLEKDKYTEEEKKKLFFSTIEDMCLEYIKSLAWVSRYYYDGYVDWNYYYPYHYTPLIYDISTFFDTKYSQYREELKVEPKKGKREEKGNYDILDQLIAILPRKAIEAMNEPYSQIPKILSSFFPSKVDLDTHKYTRKSKFMTIQPNIILLLPHIEMFKIMEIRQKLEKDYEFEEGYFDNYVDKEDIAVIRGAEKTKIWIIDPIKKKEKERDITEVKGKERTTKVFDVYNEDIKIKRIKEAKLIWKLSSISFIRISGGEVFIPHEKLTEKNKEFIVSFITQRIRDGSIGFPYTHLYFKNPKVVLENETKAAYVKYENWGQDSMTSSFSGDRWKLMRDKHVILYYDSDYDNIDVLTDYFTEDARVYGIFKGPNGNTLNLLDGFKENSQNVALKAYEHAMKRGKDLDTEALHEGIYHAGVPSCTTFKISVAIAINRIFSPKLLFDPFGGWGDRALGAMLAGTQKYITTDPNTRLRKGYQKIKQFISDVYEGERSVEFFDLPIEKLPLSVIFQREKPDLIFSGPPYYDYEIYTSEKTQSHAGKTEKEWTDWFHSSTKSIFSILKDGGHLVYYLGRCGSLDIPKNLIRFMEREVKNSSYLGLIPIVNADRISHPKFCYVWKKERK